MKTIAGTAAGIVRGGRLDTDVLEARLGSRLTAPLALAAMRLPHDVEERLRVGREQALARSRAARQASPVPASAALGPTVIAGHGRAATLASGGDQDKGWFRWAGGLLPLAVLVGGLLAIGQFAAQQNAQVAADLDAQLLSDNLPPSAYSDPGFAAFLRSGDDSH